MKVFIITFCISSLCTILLASEGKRLYMDANCQKCHGIDQDFDPKNSKVKSLHDLKGWVSSCAGNFNVHWFPQEEEKVTKYLNETHYKFKNE